MRLRTRSRRWRRGIRRRICGGLRRLWARILAADLRAACGALRARNPGGGSAFACRRLGAMNPVADLVAACGKCERCFLRRRFALPIGSRLAFPPFGQGGGGEATLLGRRRATEPVALGSPGVLLPLPLVGAGVVVGRWPRSRPAGGELRARRDRFPASFPASALASAVTGASSATVSGSAAARSVAGGPLLGSPVVRIAADEIGGFSAASVGPHVREGVVRQSPRNAARPQDRRIGSTRRGRQMPGCARPRSDQSAPRASTALRSPDPSRSRRAPRSPALRQKQSGSQGACHSPLPGAKLRAAPST